MKFGPKKPGTRLSFQDLFTDRNEEQERWIQLLKSKVGSPLPVQIYYGVSGEGKTFLRRQLRRLTVDKAGVPCVVIDLDKLAQGQRGPDRAALALRMVHELEMAAPRVQLAALYIAMEEAKAVIDYGELKAELASNALGEAADAFILNLQDNFESFSIGGLVGAIAKTGLQAYKRSKEPLQEYLKNSVGQLDKVRLQNAESLEEIREEMFDRFGLDLQNHTQPGTEGRAAKIVLLIDTLDADSSGVGRPIEAKEHLWIGELYSACNEAANGSKPRLLIAAFGRSQVSHGIPEGHFQEIQLSGIPESDARDYLINRRNVAADCVDWMIQEAKIDTRPLCHAFSLGLLADSFAQENDLPAVEDEWKHLTPVVALARRFLKQIKQGETGDANYLAKLALTPVWDEAAAAFAFGVESDPEKSRDKLDWLMSFSFVQPAMFPHALVPGFTLHAIIRKALIETSQDSDEVRRHHEWLVYWRNRSTYHLDTADRAAWWHKFCLSPFIALEELKQAATEALIQLDAKTHLELIDLLNDCQEIPKPSHQPEVEWSSFRLQSRVALADQLSQSIGGNIYSSLLNSVEIYKSATQMAIPSTDESFKGLIFNNLGNAVWRIGDSSQDPSLILEALDYYNKAHDIRTKLDNTGALLITKQNIANAYCSLTTILSRADYGHKAMDACDQGLKLINKLDDLDNWSSLMLVKANIHLALGHFEDGADYYKNAEQIYNELINDYKDKNNLKFMSKISGNLAACYGFIWQKTSEIDALRTATSLLEKSLETIRRSGVTETLAITLENLGKFQLELGMHTKTLKHLKRSLDFSQESLSSYTELGLKERSHRLMYSIGQVYRANNQVSRTRDSLDNAIFWLKEYLDNTAPGQRPEYELSSNFHLAHLVWERYKQDHDEQSLKDCLKYIEEIETTALEKSHEHKRGIRILLAIIYGHLGEEQGNIHYLDKSQTLLYELVSRSQQLNFSQSQVGIIRLLARSLISHSRLSNNTAKVAEALCLADLAFALAYELRYADELERLEEIFTIIERFYSDSQAEIE